MITTKIPVELDDSIKNNEFFKKIQDIEIDKPTIFKYGILNEQIPEKIKENEFEYLEGKIPFLAGLNEDFIDIEKNQIINLASEEKAKTISEIIGVGVGLYYTSKLFSVNPCHISKIDKPQEQGKYMDFKFRNNNRNVYIETKGTVYNSSINKMINDIKEKKKNTKDATVKLGTLTLARKKAEDEPSKIIVCDDFNRKKEGNRIYIGGIIEHYMLFLSLLLDSHHYNILKRKIHRNGFNNIYINKKMIPNIYVCDGVHYIGKCFDKRLILDYIADYYRSADGIKELFYKLTNGIGLNKYFVGIDIRIIDAINRKDFAYFNHIDTKKKVSVGNNCYSIFDEDGVIIAASIGGQGDKQIEKLLTEEDVLCRLKLIASFIDRSPHECGAPCTSKGIEGKPCEKLTFRDHCYFHRK